MMVFFETRRCPRTTTRAHLQRFGCADVQPLIDSSAERRDRERPALNLDFLLRRSALSQARALDKLIGGTP